MKQRLRRRWFSFSLRTLLVVTALACAGLKIGMNQVFRQRAAISALLEHKHATVYFEGCDPFLDPDGYDRSFDLPLGDLSWNEYRKPVVGLQLGSASDDILARISGFQDLQQIHFCSDNTVTNEGLKHIATFQNLEQLQILGSFAVTDDGLGHLVRLKKLRKLSLLGTQVTPAGVNELRNQLPKCEIYVVPSKRQLAISKQPDA